MIKKYYVGILPPIILYIVLVFEKRKTKEIIVLVVINLLFWLLFSSFMFTPQVWGLQPWS